MGPSSTIWVPVFAMNRPSDVPPPVDNVGEVPVIDSMLAVTASTKAPGVVRNGAFIEVYCLIPEGAQVGQPIKLMKFQRKFILDVFDNLHGTSRAYLSVARKNGKSALIAAILLAHLVGPEARQNSQIISGARSRDQASLVFKLAKKNCQTVA